jgi:hypothetical protein
MEEKAEGDKRIGLLKAISGAGPKNEDSVYGADSGGTVRERGAGGNVVQKRRRPKGEVRVYDTKERDK